MNEEMLKWASAGAGFLGVAAYLGRHEEEKAQRDVSYKRHRAAFMASTFSEVAYHVCACASAVTRGDFRYGEYHAEQAEGMFVKALMEVGP